MLHCASFQCIMLECIDSLIDLCRTDGQAGGGRRKVRSLCECMFVLGNDYKAFCVFFLSAEKGMLSIFQKQKQNELLHIGTLLGAIPVGSDDCNIKITK